MNDDDKVIPTPPISLAQERSKRIEKPWDWSASDMLREALKESEEHVPIRKAILVSIDNDGVLTIKTNAMLPDQIGMLEFAKQVKIQAVE